VGTKGHDAYSVLTLKGCRPSHVCDLLIIFFAPFGFVSVCCYSSESVGCAFLLLWGELWFLFASFFVAFLKSYVPTSV